MATLIEVKVYCATHDLRLPGEGWACIVCAGARHPRLIRSHRAPWWKARGFGERERWVKLEHDVERAVLEELEEAWEAAF